MPDLTQLHAEILAMEPQIAWLDTAEGYQFAKGYAVAKAEIAAKIKEAIEREAREITDEWLRSFRDSLGEQLFGEENGEWYCAGLRLKKFNDHWRVQIGDGTGMWEYRLWWEAERSR